MEYLKFARTNLGIDLLVLDLVLSHHFPSMVDNAETR